MFNIEPKTYKFNKGDTIKIPFEGNTTYGYCYGIADNPVNVKTKGNFFIILDLKPGIYKECYIGTYIKSVWTQSENFNIVVLGDEKPVPNPNPLPNPEPIPVPKPKPVPNVRPSENDCNTKYLSVLQLLDINKKKVAGLLEFQNLSIEHALATSCKTLNFTYKKDSKFYEDIVEESYIRTKTDEYVVKEKDVSTSSTNFKCVLNVEALEGNAFDRFLSEEQTIEKALNLALVGTGWTCKDNSNITKKRTIRLTNKSTLEIIQQAQKTYIVDIAYDTLNKVVNIYEHLGNDRGTYFIDSLNLKTLSIQGNSYQYYTRIIPLGKDGLTIEKINNGKKYVENYQYSKKVKTLIWKDDRYTVAESLLEDAKAKLNEISKPYRSYAATIINLAKLNKTYNNILDYRLGDTITLISQNNKVKEKQRIVKLVEYPMDHSKDTVQLANTVLSFEEVQKQFQDTSETVDNITTSNGSVDGKVVDGLPADNINGLDNSISNSSSIQAINGTIKDLKADNITVNHLVANKADIGDLNAVTARIGTLEATKANITDLNALNATIDNLSVNKANIKDLTATNAKIKILDADTASIKVLLNGNISSENIQAGGITSDKLTIASGFIKDAMISSLDAGKITSGSIDTSHVTISSSSGNLLIKDNTIQIRDKNSKTRVQIGKDASGDYDMFVFDETGNIMFDATGITANGIKNKIIRDDMVADDANISGYKLDINSVVSSINDGTSTLQSSKINIDTDNQTLDIAFKKLKSSTDKNSSNLENVVTEIGIAQGQIKTAISKTEILDGAIIDVKQNIADTNGNITDVKDKLDNLQIGGPNLLSNTRYMTNFEHWGFLSSYFNIVENENVPTNIRIGENVFWLSNATQSEKLAGQDIRVCLSEDSYYTASCYLYIEENVTSVELFLIGTDKNNNMIFAKPVSYSPRKNWFIATNTQLIPKEVTTLTFRLDNNGSVGQHNSVWFTQSKLEPGNIRTAWNYSSIDIQSYSNDVAEAKATLAKEQALASADGKITAEEQARINADKENLQTAIDKADEVKSYANASINQSKADLKKYADDVANAKAELAKQEAIANADGKITTEEQERIKQAQDNLNAAMSKIKEVSDDANDKIGTLDTSYKTLKDSYNKTKETVDSISNTIADQQTILDKASSEIVEMKVASNTTNKTVNSLSTEIQSVKSSYTTTKKDIENLNSAITDKIDTITDNVNSLESTLNNNTSGILTDVEKNIIENELNNLAKEKAIIDAKYKEIINNPLLS